MRNRTTNKCIVLDIHWNSAAVNTATGTETLVPSDADIFELSLASEYSKVISETLGIPMRGLFKGYSGVRSESESHHGRLGWMRLTGKNILSEVCFINNPHDMNLFFANRGELIVNLCDLLDKFSRNQIGTVSTLSGALNVRQSPNAQSQRVGVLNRGANVFISGESNGFYYVANSDGIKGWSSKQFITLLNM
jgi:hypothetical protein